MPFVFGGPPPPKPGTTTSATPTVSLHGSAGDISSDEEASDLDGANTAIVLAKSVLRLAAGAKRSATARAVPPLPS